MSGRHSALIGYAVMLIFVMIGLGVIYLEELRTQEHVTDGTTCLLGSVFGVEGIQRPSGAEVTEACERYLVDIDINIDG